MSWSRRHLLSSTALATLGWGLPRRSHGEALPLLGGRARPVPDLRPERLAQARRLIGVRPHRRGGVCLELAPEPLPGSTPPKRVVHNYGHGAAGITLAFGCAEHAADHVQQAMATLGDTPPAVAVLGTGIAGLTTAWELRKRHPSLPICIYASSLELSTTTSWVAGGQFEPSTVWREYRSEAGKAGLFDYLRRSRAKIDALTADHDRYGIAPRDYFTLDHDIRAIQEFTPPDVIAPYTRGRLPFPALQAPGRHYETFLLNPMILLPAIQQELQASGVRFVARHFATRRDLAALAEPILVNCTGYGARALFGDERLLGQRGHLLVVDLEASEGLDYLFGGGCENEVISYLFCRQNDLVVGGTFAVGEDETRLLESDAPVFERVWDNAGRVFEGHPETCRVE